MKTISQCLIQTIRLPMWDTGPDVSHVHFGNLSPFPALPGTGQHAGSGLDGCRAQICADGAWRAVQSQGSHRDKGGHTTEEQGDEPPAKYFPFPSTARPAWEIVAPLLPARPAGRSRGTAVR